MNRITDGGGNWATVYCGAVTALVAAILLRWLIDPLMGDTLPHVTLFGAVAAAVWLGGYRPALLVAVLGYVACAYLFIEPRGTFGITEARNLVGLIVYLVTCSIIIGFGETMRVSQRRFNELIQQQKQLLPPASIADNARRKHNFRDVTWVGFGLILVALVTGDVLGYVNAIHLTENEEMVSYAHIVISELDKLLSTVKDAETGQRGYLLTEDDEYLQLYNDALETVPATFDCLMDLKSDLTSDNPDQEVRLDVLKQKVGQFLDELKRAVTLTKAGDRTAALDVVRSNIGKALMDDLRNDVAVMREAAQMLLLRRAEEAEASSRITAGSLFLSIPVEVILVGIVWYLTKRSFAQRQRAAEQGERLRITLAAERRKDEFLAMLAHELRGPLAPLQYTLEIANTLDLFQQHNELYSTMERQLSQLVRLVDDLIDVSRITRNKIELRKERVELESVIYHSVDAIRPLAESGNQRMHVTFPPEPIYLHADPIRLIQVFSNILHNACKYTGSGGRIWLAAERQGSEVVVKIKDTGIGIAPEKIDSVFEMFTQLERTLERSQQGGLGIGLTLVKRLVELHGGLVKAYSEGQSHGSEFVVHLPILIESREAVSQARTVEPTKMTARRILVVDDDQETASSLAMLLKMHGHETGMAHDGLEAVEAAESFRPDVVLLDIGLPKLNGYDVCRRIREQPWGKNMVVVALTGWGQDDDRRKSREAGFDGHLVKPVGYADIIKLLAEKGGGVADEISQPDFLGLDGQIVGLPR